MTTILPIYGTPPKRDIITRAYGFCGQATYEFELTAEEYVAGLRAMDDQLAPYCPQCGYNLPQEGDGNPADNSGILKSDILGVSYYVAKLLAPQIGKQLQVNKDAARACDAFLARYSEIPFMGFGRNTIRGAGNRYWRNWGSPFLPTKDDLLTSTVVSTGPTFSSAPQLIPDA